MEQQNKNSSKKAVIIAIAVVLVAALAIGGYFLLSTESRLTGVWSGGPVYLKKYGGDCYQIVSFGEDGDYTSVMTNDDGDVVSLKVGVWELSGFEVKATCIGEDGRVTYDYNPLTNKLSSGSWSYEKTN